MSIVSGITHVLGNVAAPVLETGGAVLSPLTGANNELTQAGHNISNQSVNLTNPAGLITGNSPAFSGSGAYGQVGSQAGTPTNVATPGTGVQDAGSGAYTGIDPTTGYSYDYLTSLANGQLGNLGQQESVGNQNILDAYNTQLNSLNGSNALAQRNYQTNTDQTLQDYVGARGNSQAQVGQQANSLQRLLGAHGYQGSANQAAAYAAALQGTQANNALQGQYAKNQQSLDTNFGDYSNQFQNQLSSLGQQKTQQQNALESQVATTKQSLLQQLAGIASAKGGSTAAYTPQIDQLGQQITALGQNYANPVLQATAPVYQAPTLGSYDAPTQAAAQVSGNAAANNVNPYLSVLLNGQQDKTNLNNIPG